MSCKAICTNLFRLNMLERSLLSFGHEFKYELHILWKRCKARLTACAIDV